jgi:GH25 family lysozyme M1 (1,4-beta-N-acetylmuramidase)
MRRNARHLPPLRAQDLAQAARAADGPPDDVGVEGEGREVRLTGVYPSRRNSRGSPTTTSFTMRPSKPVSIASLLVALGACAPGGTPGRDPAQFRQEQGQTVCAAGPTVRGVDISEWQGNINWGQVAASGIAFAYVRVSDGIGHSDPYFQSNWANSKAAGLKRGAYQFFEPSESASAQAQLVVNAVGRLGPGDLPVMMDVETSTPNAGELDAWLAAVEQGTGKRPIIYTSPGLWNPWFPGGGYGSDGLMVANWGVSCPSLPAGWSDWVVWQYADNGSVPGISGGVDSDYFNGSQAQLDAYAASDIAPRGYLDAASCDGISGWAQDQDVPAQSIDVHLYFGGPAGSGAPAVRGVADTSRADLCSAIGSCTHGFDLAAPRSLFDGAAHPVHAYGIDTSGSNNAELTDSPKSLLCAPSESGVRRHVTDPASFAAWGLSSFQDVRPISDATWTGYATGPDWPAAPQLIRGSGLPEVYAVDGNFKRHVVSPASAAQWHLDLSTVQVVPAAQIQAMPTGPDLRERPMGIQSSAPDVDLLDDPLPVVGTTSTSGSTGSTTSTSTTGSTGSTTATASTSTSGSSTAGSTTGSGSTTGAIARSTTGGSTTASAPRTTSGSSGQPKAGGCGSASGGTEWLAFGLVTTALVRRRRGRVPVGERD